MQITELKKEGLNFQVKVTIPFSKIETKIQKELGDLSKKTKIDGFRAGKVPMHVVSKKYHASVKSDVLQHEISHAISDVVKSNNLKISGEPEVEDFYSEDGKDTEFVLKFELLPKIDMPDFKKISVEKPVLKTDQKVVDERLQALVKFKTEYSEIKKGKAALSDQVVIDAIGYVDEKAFDNGKLDDYKLVLGSKSFIDTFEDQLVGTKAGQEITVDVTFPKDYGAKDLAGKKAKFRVTVKEVFSPKEPELNDDFAKIFKFENLAELTQSVEQDLASNYSDGILTLMKMSLFDQLEDMLTFEVPNSVLEREIASLKSQFEKDDEDIKKKSETEQQEYYKKLALRRIRIGLMISEYAVLNNIKVDQDDIWESVVARAKQFPGQESEVIKFYQNNKELLKSLGSSVLENKATQNILDKEIKLTEKSYSKEKLDKLLD